MLRLTIHTTCWILTKILYLLYLPCLLWYKLQTPKRCPPITEEIYLMPAVVLAEKIRKRQVTSYGLVEVYVRRVKEVNPVLNAVVQDRFDLALEEAQHVDKFLEDCGMSSEELAEKFPLLGIPLTVKESVGVAGMSNNGGYKREGERRVAEDDCECIKRLKSAGVIIILVSNTPELCLNWETFNYVTGRTYNPYDTRRTCGGSSGGEAVLLATCGSIIGVGSDLVGSLRLPPTFCGVFGHKPTAGLINNKGHFPSCADDTEEFWRLAFTFGPMTRYATDLTLMLKIMINPELKHISDSLTEVNVKSIKVYYMEGCGSTFPIGSVNSEIVQALRKAIGNLTAAEIFTKKINIKELSDSFDLTFVPLLDLKTIQHPFSFGKSIYTEIFRTIFGTATVIPNAIFFVWVKTLFNLFASEKKIQHNKNLLNILKENFLEILGNDGVFLYPAFTSTAHFHGQIYSKALDSCYLGIFNTLGFPVTICPIGTDSNGLPISIQIVGTPFNDKLCLAVARELEKMMGGWQPPKYKRQPEEV